MALLEQEHPALQGGGRFWEDELANCRIILYELDKAILALTRQEIKAYTLNTGQNNTSVTRQDLPLLIQRRADIIKQIQELEALAGDSGPVAVQVIPV